MEGNIDREGLQNNLLKLGEEINSLQVKHDLLEQKVQQASSSVSSMGSGGFKGALSSNELKTLMEKVNQVENNSALMSANLSDTDLKLQLLENTTYNGRQIWKVTT